MIVAEGEKEDFTAMLPGEELLQEKEIEGEQEENNEEPAPKVDVEKSPEGVTKTLDFVYNQEI